MTMTSIALRAAAAVLGGAALLACAPTALAEEPPNCEQQPPPPEQQQQCDQGAGIANQIIDGVQDGVDRIGQADQPTNPEAIDLSDMNCMVVNGVPMMVVSGQVFQNVYQMDPCWVVHGLTPHP